MHLQVKKEQKLSSAETPDKESTKTCRGSGGCHLLPAAVSSSDWTLCKQHQGWWDVKKPKVTAKSLVTGWEILPFHMFQPLEFFKPAVLRSTDILATQRSYAKYQGRGLREGQHFGLWKSQGSNLPTQVLVWFLSHPCRNHAIWRQIYLLVSKRKT